MQNRDIPKFIEDKQLVVVDVLADPAVEEDTMRRNGTWQVTQYKFKKGFHDEEERLYVTMESVDRKNKAFINLPYDPLVIRPANGKGPSLAEAFQDKMQLRRRVAAPRQARFKGPGI